MSRLQKESSLHSVASTSQESPSLMESEVLRVTLLGSEWRSSKGDLSTINRELAIQLAKHPNVDVSVYVPRCSEEDRRAARSHDIQLIEAQELPGHDQPVDWLASLPEGHHPHCVIGHGVHLGRQIPLIQKQQPCKWIQVVHTAPEELGMFKSYEETIFRGEKKHRAEVKLCELADGVVAIGPKLADAYSRYLRSSKKDFQVFNLTPSIFTEFCHVEQATEEGKNFCVLLFGRGDHEDFELKGYDVAVEAIAQLDDKSYQLNFVGTQTGKEEEVARKLLEYGIPRSQLTVRCFKEDREELASLFCEADLAIMPSRTEGFGLTGLEALSAGLPVLISGNSGLGEALEEVPFGSPCVINSEDPKEWANAIKVIRQKKRKVRLGEAFLLRKEYAAKYSWQRQCESLVEKMGSLVFVDPVTSQSSAGFKENESLTSIAVQRKDAVINKSRQASNREVKRSSSSVATQSVKRRKGQNREPSSENDQDPYAGASSTHCSGPFYQGYHPQDVTPPYVLARGPLAFEAFQRALQSGKTFDKRTKILLTGQDRVGKTSLGKHLRGEKFKEDEPSTDGVEMMPAIKNASLQAWRNPVSLDSTSAFDHKCAEVVTKELLSNSPEKSDSVVQSTEESAGGESTKEMRTRESVIKESGTEETRGDELIHEAKTESIEDVRPEQKPEEIPREVSSSGNSRSTTPIQTAKDDIEEPNQEQMPVNVASLVESGLERNVPNNGDSIWPVIWDFAGQAVYHAIHPIFLSQDAIYVLALDLTRELDDLAKCRVRTIDHEEVEVRSPCSKDTNLDHIMKWLDLVHSLQNLEQTSVRKPCEPSPQVILVGTHADSVRNLGRDPDQEMNVVYDTICKMAPTEILTHISGYFVIDNTKAGNSDQQEDPQIVSLRQRILEVAENMPHTKMEVPMQWLRVEEKISEMVRNDVHYVTKERFQEDVAEAFCHFDVKDDVEELLHFLHARGTVIYHALPENPKGLVVLDPRWLIKVLTSIITVNPPPNTPAPIRKKYQDLENKGLLSDELLDHALQKWNLEGVREDLLDVMEKFDLICDSRGFQGEDYRYIVPCMLKPLIEDVGSNDVNNGPLPVFLTFSTNYVPSGLFCRLVVLFWEWASQLCKARELPTLYANAARFNVSKLYHLTMEAHQTLIRLRLWTGGECIPEEEKRLCGQLLRHLDDCRTKLQSKYHWLKSVSWDLFLQCTLCKPCPAKCRKETKICVWHKKQGCCHSDCGHYIPLEGYTESCRHSAREAPSFCQEKLNPWIQVSEPPASSELKKGIVKQGTPTNDELEKLGKEISEKWMQLGRRLRVEEPKLRDIEQSHRQLCEKGYNMLLAWKQKNGSAATYEILNAALQHELVQRRDLAEQFCLN